jgi:hypothetical protein
MHTKRTKEKQKEEQFAEVEKEKKKRFFHGNKCALGYTISQRNILRIH